MDLDGVLGAAFAAGVGKTALAAIGDPVLLFRAAMAGELDEIDKRRLVVFFRNGAFVHPHGKGGVLVHGAQRQAHSQAQPLPHNGALQEDGFPVLGHLPWDNLIGQLLDAGIIPALIAHPSHLGKNPAANILYRCLHPTHIHFSFLG